MPVPTFLMNYDIALLTKINCVNFCVLVYFTPLDLRGVVQFDKRVKE